MNAPHTALALGDLLLNDWSWGRAIAGLVLVGVLLSVAFLIDFGIERFVGRVRAGHGAWRGSVLRAAPVIRLLLLVATTLVAAMVAFDIHPLVLVSLLAVAVLTIGMASVDIVRNVIAGAVIGSRKPFRVGDRVAAAGYEGEVVHIGLRSTVLLTPDGERLAIPNRRFVTDVSVRVCIPDTGAPVRIDIPVPLDMDLTAARNLAFRCACVSKYASARRRPEVHVAPSTDGTERVVLQVRAYAFDGRYAEHLRSEVVEIMSDGLRSARPAPASRP